ncbi:DUF3040 domain-containing protein [Amycolatopsis jiangsuensis]|uniref:Putative membrane protein YphA (DoxX/SURF4 family) n=1 Tax=Amycolatopsis jiangsuensis TaxID=1181879 RepID=A0A840IPE5_9PSEU|nr:DUF3040 domain-containing protein [Amycolatopsis jiangsuensis]MBB4683227.1 putative membrane protein YphA (DoxX/SURF4 family) [Amycolatopsis jiangsuensis]
MLSHHERAELDKIEHWFETSDPDLAAALQRGVPARSAGLLLVLTVLLDITAAGLLVTGLLTASPALTLCALLAAAGGVAAHVARCHDHR